MSGSTIGERSMHRSGFHVLGVLCFANAAVWYLVHGKNYVFVPLLLGAALLFDTFWPKVGAVVRSREKIENKVNHVLASDSESTPVSQLPTNKSEENNDPMKIDDVPAPSTPPQRQTSESDDYWDEVYRQCVEQKKKMGNKAQTRRRRG